MIGDIALPQGPKFVLDCRPEDIRIDGGSGAGIRFTATVIALQPLGASVLVDLQIEDNGERLVAAVAWDEQLPKVGDSVAVRMPADRLSYFSTGDGARLNTGAK